MTQTTGRDPERLGLSARGELTTPAGVSTDTLLGGRFSGWRLPPALRARSLARPGVAEVLIGLTALAFFSWRIGRPSPWFDEAVTRDVVSRPAGEIADLVAHVDLVHAAYYLLVHAVLPSTDSFTPIRMLSAVAAALTAVVLVRLGRELGSARVGIAAGMLWTIAPLVTRYAQEARPYAMVALASTVATLALVRVCRRPWLRTRWLVYIAAMIVTGLLNVISLLLFLPHLSYVLATSSRPVRIRWYGAAGSAVAALMPLLVAAGRQSEQVSWLPVPRLDRLTDFWLAEFAIGIAVVGLLVPALAGIGRGTHAPSLGLGLSWAVLPPVALWTISQVDPLYDWRYVFFTVPGTALALASLAPLLRMRWAVVGITVLALAGLHMQNVYRYPVTGHAEDVRGAAEAIAAGGRPGDAVIFLPMNRRVVQLAYPEAFRAVDDVALARTPQDSATLFGVEVPASEVSDVLRKRSRVWVVTGPPRFGETLDQTEREKERLLYNGYHLVGVTFTRRYEVRLYERDRASTAVPASTGAVALT